MDRSEIQAAQQKSRSKIAQNPPKVGDRCFARKETIKSKLDPRFNGPYKIIEITSTGNYQLDDATGFQVAGSFTLSKLKPYFNPGKISKTLRSQLFLGDKTENHETFYKVKWTTDDEYEWVAEDDFNAVELINSYCWIKMQIKQINKKTSRTPL